MTKTREYGFTLIELSIVLVIIGLIVGGVLTGQTLIQSASMRKVATELEKYQTAVVTFRGKYDCLPGDCLNATTYFGADGSGCPANINVPPNTTGTCNGNGDGLINGWSNGGTVPVEHFLAWSHLSYAGMINPIDMGPTYVNGNTSPSYKGGAIYQMLYVGQNVPATAFSSTIGYDMMNADPLLKYSGAYPPAVSANQLVMQIGGASSSNDQLTGAGFTAPQAMQLDIKLDDGMPNTGRISSINAALPGYGNTNTTCLSGTAYSGSAATGCVVYYLMKTP